MVENVCVTVSNYATEALQDTLNFYGKEGFSLAIIILLSADAVLLQCAEQRTNTLLESHIYSMPFELKPKKSLFPHRNSRCLAMLLLRNYSQ